MGHYSLFAATTYLYIGFTSSLMSDWLENRRYFDIDLSAKYIVTSSVLIINLTLVYTGWAKVLDHSAFSRISRNDFFAQIKSVCTKHVYNVRVCSFYYIKWRHLVNLLPRNIETQI